MNYLQDVIVGWRLSDQNLVLDGDWGYAYEITDKLEEEEKDCCAMTTGNSNGRDMSIAIGIDLRTMTDRIEPDGCADFDGDTELPLDIFARLANLKSRIEKRLGMELGDARIINSVDIC